MTDIALPPTSLGLVSASVKVNRRAITDAEFRRWVARCVYRHLCCDWGQVTTGVAEDNFASLVIGGSVLSRWTFDDDALMIVQDDEHGRTTVMLQSESNATVSGPNFQEI
jgi:hypothetical protein